jgi:hypothetical protein
MLNRSLLLIALFAGCHDSGIPVTGDLSTVNSPLDLSASIDMTAIGQACTADDQCGASSYCRGELSVCKSQCQLTIGLATTGMCHRSCVGPNPACTCVDDADCPGFYTSCDLASGTCKTLAPPVCHAVCPAGCADSGDTQFGEVCICASCP